MARTSKTDSAQVTDIVSGMEEVELERWERKIADRRERQGKRQPIRLDTKRPYGMTIPDHEFAELKADYHHSRDLLMAHLATCEEREANRSKQEAKTQQKLDAISAAVKNQNEDCPPSNFYALLYSLLRRFGLTLVFAGALLAVLYWAHLERIGQAAQSLEQINQKLEQIKGP